MTEAHRRQFTLAFVVIFYVLALYKFWNGLWLYQFKPYFFVNRFDGVTWLFMRTGIHQWLIDNEAGWALFDGCFYAMPIIYFVAYLFHSKTASVIAIVWFVVNWVYVQCYTLYPTNSIEGHIAWLLMPLLFATRRLRSFYYLMHGLRYFFLFFFVSAAIWKIRQGGLFYPEQMSGILLMQHANYLVSAPDAWFTKLIYWLVNHEYVGYTLYILATVLELSLVMGFFTRRYDRWLLGAFIIFLLMDLFLMRIPYFEILALVLPLVYSRLEEPRKKYG